MVYVHNGKIDGNVLSIQLDKCLFVRLLNKQRNILTMECYRRIPKQRSPTIYSS